MDFLVSTCPCVIRFDSNSQPPHPMVGWINNEPQVQSLLALRHILLLYRSLAYENLCSLKKWHEHNPTINNIPPEQDYVRLLPGYCRSYRSRTGRVMRHLLPLPFEIVIGQYIPVGRWNLGEINAKDFAFLPVIVGHQTYSSSCAFGGRVSFARSKNGKVVSVRKCSVLKTQQPRLPFLNSTIQNKNMTSPPVLLTTEHSCQITILH